MVTKSLVKVTIDKLVHGGQGIGALEDGRKVFVWNALPGEEVEVELTRQKRDYAEGIARNILKASKDRLGDGHISDEDLSTRPWAIISGIQPELDAKEKITRELFDRENITLPAFEVKTFGALSNYRNKMEYCFWGDDDGLWLAHFRRGTHGKIKIDPYHSALGNDHLNGTASELISLLNKQQIRASQLKSVIIRAVMDSGFSAAVALFVKDESFPKIDLPARTVVYYSNPKSPASVPTKELYRTGDTTITQKIGSTSLSYDVLSFFQVNKPIFEKALDDIKAHILAGMPVVDMYAGVGTIGLALGARPLTLVESDPSNIQMAKQNAGDVKDIKVVHASTEKVLEYVVGDSCLIVDPPRSGLHQKLVEAINDVKPTQLVYLSCNPATQARDIAKLSENYKMTFFSAYNFFPRTPHIETLAILEKK